MKTKENIKYIQSGDYLIPDFRIEKDVKLSKLGTIYKIYFTEENNINIAPALYPDWLIEHLIEVDDQMTRQYNLILEQYIELYKIDEELKSSNQMRWVQEMNNIKSIVEKVVLMNFIK